ncbi:SIS domain-containing protein [Herbiconiux sp. L3-i23]|uniref:SIS domain-containing protein n=1 Tax=Herbiconiux sp. L3-i23 TaxID=2905871 RepID=UPI00206B4A3D|nr:SIS domain-containing protein [Herbiconiux sp. L3-i23]BDI23169.1 glucosamine-6-phosphate deaminase [Herbiconiux sp. L3-i23]
MSGADSTTPGALIRAEIAEQPAAWRRLLTAGREQIIAAATLLRDTDPELIVFAARGTSDHAAMYAQYLAHVRLGIPAMLATPSAFTAYGARLSYPRAVLVAVTQSGESPDLIETVRVAKSAGVPVIAVTNVAESMVAGLGDVPLDLVAGPELSVAATKTYTAELLALHAVISLAAGDRWDDVAARIGAVADAAEKLLAGEHPGWNALADTVAKTDRILVVGRGYSMASAREGALKLMETNGIAASGWSAADATHGPLGQVRPATLVFLLTASPSTRAAAAAFGEKASALGGTLVEVGGPASTPLHLALPTDGVDETLIPVLEIIPFQLLALDAALRRGLDPDNPEGLAKVTKTR